MRTIAMIALAATTGAALAEEAGVLNPEELSLAYFADRLEQGGGADPVASAHGYFAAKSGNYELARRIFERQAAAGVTQAMTWLAWLEDNGFGGPENPEAAAEWDARAAAAGDHVGLFNSGLNHLRGRGVPRDDARGKTLIDRAAALGDETAQRLAAEGYNPDAVTPDADEWRYGRRLY